METAPISRHDFFKLVGTSVGVILLTNCSMGCSAKGGGDPTPIDRNVDFTLRLADQANENLRAKGGYVIANDIIVAQTKDGKFIAVSASCTHEGTQLTYKVADNQFYCPLHLSRFDSTGKVLMGPATQALVQFVTVADTAAGTVRIHS
ncbi:ubiquinol-cytochrome c reductase iron-sulfur subunit [Spirosoma sp. KNUC1025]|uniref:QcrA and Rieske domain-containing protein n=1 Tax=Spirosoma sp. KNUC1025 TaxID=2894082 RepID=UPI0038661A89|nr:Rieske (2Fe-2S) protein [Spirosoma sp. KNUC1025]